MVARSTIREAGNTARLNQLTVNGYDLVKMSKYYPTCPICAPLQGRVYSISGQDKRFPPLSMAFGQYNNVHPNCRHVVTAWVESLRTPEEVQDAIEFSNQPFEDNRSAKEVRLYKEQQDQARKLRNDLYQWERYKQVLGEDAPSTVAKFRKTKYNEIDQWEKLQREYRMFNRIDTNDNYAPEYKARMKEAYQFFKDNGYEFTEHGLNRALNPKSGQGKERYSLEDVLHTLKQPVNYFDGKSKIVRYYDNLAVIQAIDTGEVISIISTKKASRSWEAITNDNK